MTFVEEADGVLAIQLFGRDDCARIIEQVRDLEGWYDAAIRVQDADGHDVDVQSAAARVASILPLWDAPEIQARFDDQVNAVIKPLIACYWSIDLDEHAGSQIVRYGVGGHYDTHDDVGETCKDRHFSIVCYLNDDFDGGGTHFPNLAYTVIPERGKAVVFPARYPHRAEPVRRGEKYVAVTWVTGPVS